MQRLLRTPTAWILVALFLLSAGHGIVLHTDHDHRPQHCALCVLGWTAALVAAVTVVSANLQASTVQTPHRNRVRPTAFTYSRSQRAPPC